MTDGSGILILVVAGLVLFRPQDVPRLARSTGRGVGITIRAIRQVRDTVDEAIQKNAGSNESPFGSLRSTLQSSMTHFSDFTTTVRRDISDIPLSPSSFIRSRLRKAAASKLKASDALGSQQNISNSVTPTYSQDAVTGPSTPTLKSTVPGSASSGSAFIARGIEEAALAQRQRNMLYQEKADSNSP